MDQEEVLSDIREEFARAVDLEYKQGSYRYFKEQIKPIGVRLTDVRRITDSYYSILRKEWKFQEIKQELQVRTAHRKDKGRISCNRAFQGQGKITGSDGYASANSFPVTIHLAQVHYRTHGIAPCGRKSA